MAGASSVTSSAAAHAGELHAVSTGLERGNGEGGEVVGLTAVATELTVRSGKSWSERGGEGDLRRPRVKTSLV